MSKLKNTFNNKGQYHGYHGYQEWYTSGKLWIRGVYKYSKQIGYVENHISRNGLTNFNIR